MTFTGFLSGIWVCATIAWFVWLHKTDNHAFNSAPPICAVAVFIVSMLALIVLAGVILALILGAH